MCTSSSLVEITHNWAVHSEHTRSSVHTCVRTLDILCCTTLHAPGPPSPFAPTLGPTLGIWWTPSNRIPGFIHHAYSPHAPLPPPWRSLPVAASMRRPPSKRMSGLIHLALMRSSSSYPTLTSLGSGNVTGGDSPIRSQWSKEAGGSDGRGSTPGGGDPVSREGSKEAASPRHWGNPISREGSKEMASPRLGGALSGGVDSNETVGGGSSHPVVVDGRGEESFRSGCCISAEPLGREARLTTSPAGIGGFGLEERIAVGAPAIENGPVGIRPWGKDTSFNVVPPPFLVGGEAPTPTVDDGGLDCISRRDPPQPDAGGLWHELVCKRIKHPINGR